MARVLVVDDQPSVLVMMESLLLQRGHAVTCVANARDAMDKLNSFPFDLLIADIVMPGGLSGFDLIKAVRGDSRFAKLVIVMLSGKREKKDVEQGILLGADDYIVKPIDPDVFLAKVGGMLREKAPETVEFVECPVREAFQWDALNEIVRVSEVGITLNSSLSIEVGTKFKVRSAFLDKMGLQSHQLRVVSCQKAPGEPSYYVIKAHFIGLTESALQPLRLWIRNNQIKTA